METTQRAMNLFANLQAQLQALDAHITNNPLPTEPTVLAELLTRRSLLHHLVHDDDPADVGLLVSRAVAANMIAYPASTWGTVEQMQYALAHLDDTTYWAH